MTADVIGSSRPRIVIRDADLDGRRVDIAIDDDRIVAIGDAVSSPPTGDHVVDASGGAVLPGLHDHHIHLFALAAAADSVPAGPPAVRDAVGLARVLRDAAQARPAGVAIRAVGYHESVAGDVDRAWLDAVVPDRPVRVQHRSGAMWILNTGALRLLSDNALDDDSRRSGRLFRADALVRDTDPSPPDIATTLDELVRMGVTGVTDLTPTSDEAAFRLLADARRRGAPLDIVVTGSPAVIGVEVPLPVGPVKLVLDDVDLPGLGELADMIARAHRAIRPVAIHTVTRATLVLAATAFDVAGTIDGDRLEHGAVIPVELLDTIRRLRLTVVTQPAFVSERGDDYLRDVDAVDLPHLWRCRSLLEAGIPVGLGTDAPYATADPWAVIAAATARSTPAGRVLGPHETIPARVALARFLAHPSRPGGPPRRVTVGAPARLVVLDRPLDAVLAEPSSRDVAAVVLDGTVRVYR